MQYEKYVRRMLGLIGRCPDNLLLKLSGSPNITRDGNTLNPKVQFLVSMLSRTPQPQDIGSDKAKSHFDIYSRLFDATPLPVQSIKDISIPSSDQASADIEHSLPIRIYTPQKTQHLMPAIVYYHGGGHVLGSIRSHDHLCRLLATESKAKVIAVDYRRAPEAPFPAAADDCIAAYQWVHDNAQSLHIQADRIGVAGDDTGGNLAAVVCQQAKLKQLSMPYLQLLLYPATDLRMKTQSYRTYGNGFGLTMDNMAWFNKQYLGDSDSASDPKASPLLNEDLSGLPPAFVATAGFDPLKDEGEQYAEKLEAAGNDVVYRCHGSLAHGFASMTGVVEEAKTSMQEATQWLQKELYAPVHSNSL